MLPRKCSQPPCRNMLVTTDDHDQVAGTTRYRLNELLQLAVANVSCNASALVQ